MLLGTGHVPVVPASPPSSVVLLMHRCPPSLAALAQHMVSVQTVYTLSASATAQQVVTHP
eukprot:356623-Chlamydomonas_euryale.AAC.8